MHFGKPGSNTLSGKGHSLTRNQHESAVRDYYLALYRAWGPQHWWPAETPFEVIVGAYLTQNTAWINVERALANLRAAKLLSVAAIRRVTTARLERRLRPSGYFRQKTKRLKTFVEFLHKNYGGSLDLLFSQPTERLRQELLSLDGVGPETADSILLYAANHPVFVVDAYTRRILERHGILSAKSDYEEIRALCERALTPLGAAPLSADPVRPATEYHGAAHSPSAVSTSQRTPLSQVYNEMHGLIAGVGKHYCKKAAPQCESCPLRPFLPSEEP